MEAPSKGLRKGAWTADEDSLLRRCIDQYGEGKWHQVPIRAGLNRCRKSCRLRWLNYLKPNIKRGKLSTDEVDLLLRLHKLLGNRWSLIAGRLPGRTANDVKNYWNTHLSKKKDSSSKPKTRKKDTTTSNCVITPTTKIDVIKPRPRSFVNNSGCSQLEVPSKVNISVEDGLNNNNNNNNDNNINNNVCEDQVVNKESMWWESLLEEDDVELDGGLTEKMTEKSCLMKSTCASFDVDQLWSLFDGENEDLK